MTHDLNLTGLRLARRRAEEKLRVLRAVAIIHHHDGGEFAGGESLQQFE
jgi:hypothetical protein